jgi:hypothetical protein
VCGKFFRNTLYELYCEFLLMLHGMLLVREGRDEITQFSVQFSHASTKCYWGLWFVLRGKRAMRRKKSRCVQGVFNPIYKVKYYCCIHMRSPLCSVIVLSSVSLQHMQTCCSECDVLMYIFHFP